MARPMNVYWTFREDHRDGAGVPDVRQVSGPYLDRTEAEDYARSYAQPGQSTTVRILEVPGIMLTETVVPRP